MKIWLLFVGYVSLRKSVIYEDSYNLKYEHKKLYKLIHDDEASFLITEGQAVTNMPFGYWMTSVVVCPRSDIANFRKILLQSYSSFLYEKCAFRKGYKVVNK